MSIRNGSPTAAFVTVTPHAVVDEIYSIEDYQAGGTYRCDPPTRFPAGKGVNTAYALAALGHRPDAVVLVGEDQCETYSRFLTEQGVVPHTVAVPLRTRRHITISDPAHETTTHLQVTGREHPHEAFDRVWEAVSQSIRPGGFLTLSGSLPPGAPPDYYARLIRLAKERDVHAVLDTHGDALRLGLAEKPFAIKPNRREAEVLAGRPLAELSGQIDAALEFRESGAEWVIMTDGSEGALLVGATGTWHSVVPPQAVSAINTQGCGDCMVAGCVDAWSRGENPESVLRRGTACAVANAHANGAGLVSRDDVERLMCVQVLRSLL